MLLKMKKGFTLIELLVVIAIISLLVSILLPSLTKAKELARRAVCSTNQRAMVMAAMLYAAEHNGTTPLGWQEPNTIEWFENDNNFLKRIFEYAGNESSLFECPSAIDDNRFGGVYQPTEESRASYAANYIITARDNAGITLEAIPNSSGIVYFADLNYTRKSLSYHAKHNYSTLQVQGVAFVDDAIKPECVHDGGVNLGFVDGHAEYMKVGEPSNGMWGMTPDDHIPGWYGAHIRAF